VRKLPYYNSIKEIPVYNFDEVCKGVEGCLDYLWKDKDSVTDKQKEDIDLVSIWKSIHNEYINEFRWSSRYEDYTLIRIHAVRLLAESVETGDKSKRSLARARFQDAENMMSELKPLSLSDICARAAKFMSFPIDVMTVTAYQFYGYVKLMQS